MDLVCSHSIFCHIIVDSHFEILSQVLVQAQVRDETRKNEFLQERTSKQMQDTSDASGDALREREETILELRHRLEEQAAASEYERLQYVHDLQ